jgi:carboxyl-terminal processing protease
MENPSIRPHGGPNGFLEGHKMIRKLSLLFAGALMGASAMVMVQGAPASTAFAAAKDADVYKDLALFGDIFERARAICDAAG